MTDRLQRNPHLMLPDYFVMALMNIQGEMDSLGLKYGPGPFIVERYDKGIRAISKNRPGERELANIMMLGDSVCWQLGEELEQSLESIMGNVRR